jgi:hypothetical protein
MDMFPIAFIAVNHGIRRQNLWFLEKLVRLPGKENLGL